MANISLLSRVVNGVQRQVDLSTNTLVVGSLTVGGTGGTTLTQTILNGLISLQSHLASTTPGSAGSTYVGDDNSYTNFTPASATVKGALTGIDSALTAVAGGAANKTLSNLTSPTAVNQDLIPAAAVTQSLGSSSDAWKQLWTKEILYPSQIDFRLDTGLLYNSTGSSVADFTNLFLYDNSNVKSIDWAGRTLKDTAGTTQLTWSTTGIALAAALNMASHNINNVTDPTTAQQAATKNYVDTTTIPITQKGAASGVAPLDSSGKISVSYLPSVVMEYQGAWNPNTNTPTLSDASGTNGYVYYVTAADSGTVSGLTDPSMTNFQLGDLIIYSSSVGKWQLVTPAAGVSSVNGSQGAVTVNAINQLTGDVTASAASGSQSKTSQVSAIQGTTVTGTTGTGNVVFSISPTITGTLTAAAANFSGAITASNFSGSSSGANTGDQTITLTGDVTGSGTGSFAATIGAAKVTASKIATGAYDQLTIVGGAGTPASVANAPVVSFAGVAGQAFSANTTYAVRFGLVSNGETAGRLYAADITTTSFDLFWVVGFVQSGTAIAIAGAVNVVEVGNLTLLASDTAFGSSDNGKPIFLQSGGVNASTTAPSTSGQAAVKLGIVTSTSTFRAKIGEPYVN